MRTSKKPILFTKEGYEKKLSELKLLQEKRIPAVAELQFARDQGDRSENGAYKAARWKLSGIDSQIRRINAVLRSAQVVEKPSDSKVGMGSEIDVIWNGENKHFIIVGQEESDLSQGRISMLSPIGKALSGKKMGDTVEILVPAGKQTIKIVTVA
jgi:transcription elongation GreA/GreB family factor